MPSALSQFEDHSTTGSGTMEEPPPGEEVLAPDAEATPELEAEQAPGAQCEEELGAGQVADGADVATEALEPAEEESEARPVADGAGVATEEEPEPAAAPSPARPGGAVIMSCGIRTRDGDSLLVRFVNHEGWLEARALDCSGGSVGRVVLCGLADDDAAAQRRVCEDLAPRLIVRDGTLALGEAPVVEAPAPALAEAPAPAPSSGARAGAQRRAGAGARGRRGARARGRSTYGAHGARGVAGRVRPRAAPQSALREHVPERPLRRHRRRRRRARRRGQRLRV